MSEVGSMARIFRGGWKLRVRWAVAWVCVAVYVAGYCVPVLGIFTGAVMSCWFAGTQRVARGFWWMLGVGFVFSLVRMVRVAFELGVGGLGAVAGAEGVVLVGILLGTLPFVLHRLVSRRLPGMWATLPLPVFAVVFSGVVIGGAGKLSLAAEVARLDALLPSMAKGDVFLPLFFAYWSVALLVWAWDFEFRWAKVKWGVIAYVAAFATALGMPQLVAEGLPGFGGAQTGWQRICGMAMVGLLMWWGWVARHKEQDVYGADYSRLRSPETGAELKLGRDEALRLWLVSERGEKFPLLRGLPDFRSAEDMTGKNKKYNVLYELIAGFYDDIQRVVCAFQGFDRDAYVMSYLGKLEVSEGARVLETSVGTGLNFKYLPRGLKLAGVDLSAEMVERCRENLERWDLEAELVLGNAERLPYADESFDVVFHVGGINFFNDIPRAIGEMIRVAKPGSQILIADETEEHVKAMYEKGPVTSGFYRNRAEAVVAPVDLVPEEMEEKRYEVINVVGKNRFYVLTFKTPAVGPIAPAARVAG